MKKLIALVLAGILLFGCLGGTPPSQTPSPQAQQPAAQPAAQAPAQIQAPAANAPVQANAQAPAQADLGLPDQSKLQDLNNTFSNTSQLDDLNSKLDALLAK